MSITLKGTVTAAALLAGMVCGAMAVQAEKIVIAGRDGGYARAISMAVDLYKARNPGLEIEQLKLPYDGLLEKVTISMREKAGSYDVIMMDDTWAPEFMSSGWLANMEKIGGPVDSDFVGGALDVTRYPAAGGPVYALPFVGNVELFAYRSDLLKKYGFDKPASWDQVLRIAKTVSEKEGGVSGVVFRGTKGNPVVTGFLPVLWAFGGRVVGDDGRAQLDSDAALKALNCFLALKKYAPKGVETYNSTEVRDALMQGTTAMAIELWPSWAPSLDDPARSKVSGKIEIMSAPGQVEGPAPMLGSWLVAVPVDSENARRARDFADFLTSAEMQKRLALELGTPPTRTSVYNDADVVAKYRWYPAQLQALLDARPRARIRQWPKVEAILGDYLQLALVGQLDAGEALLQAHAKIVRELKH